MRTGLRRLVLAGAVLTVVELLAAGSYVALVVHRSEEPVTLPMPPGPFVVGRVEDTATDSSRDRDLSIWTWYPATAGTGRPASYAPGAWSGLRVVPFGESDLTEVRDPAREGADPAPGRFPTVVLEPGLGFAAPQYAVLAEDLASRGYVVVGVTPTGSANLTVLDGEAVGSTDAGNPSDFSGDHTAKDEETAAALLPTWVADARFAARTAGRLDHSVVLRGHLAGRDVAYVGHSFGGTASLEACHEDPHCLAAADLDGAEYGAVVDAGLDVPVMLVGHDGSCITGTCTPMTDADRDDVAVAHRLRSASTGPVRVATVYGVGHLDFSDDAVLYWAWPLRWYLGLGDAGSTPVSDTAALVADLVDRARAPGA